jgi:hypothetical protein
MKLASMVSIRPWKPTFFAFEYPFSFQFSVTICGIVVAFKLGLKRKPLFSFSRKAKISENLLAFEIFKMGCGGSGDVVAQWLER